MSDVNGNGDAFIPIAGPFAVKGVNAVDADDNEVLIDMIVNVRKPDEIPPSVSINPIASIITNSSVSVAGTAADNVIVKLVEVQLDSAAWIAASGTSSWLGTFGNLTDGPHVISARSKDGSGNYSTTATASFTSAAPT